MAQLRARMRAAGPAGAVILTLCTSWVLMSQLVQGLQDGWSKPWFITYILNSCYASGLVSWAILRYRRTGSLRLPAAEWCGEVRPYRVSSKQLIYSGCTLQLLSAFNGFSWFLSLPNTLLAANNSIYQSASAFVFVLSVLMAGEKVTLPKVAAVIVCVVGVCLVSFGAAEERAGEERGAEGFVHQTVEGYAWVLASTLGYSLMQVLYSKCTSVEIRSWRDLLCKKSEQVLNPLGNGVISCMGVNNQQQLTPTTSSRALTGKGDSTADGVTMQTSSQEIAPPFLGTGMHFAGVEQTSSSDTLNLVTSTDVVADSNEPNQSPKPVSSAILDAEMSALVAGCMGIGSFLTLWPLFFIMHATGYEPFVLPPDDKTKILMLSAFLDSVYQLAFMFGIVITSPLWISVGTVLVIPASLVADWVIHSATVTAQAGFGIILIVAGFFVLQVPPEMCRRRKSS